MGDRPGQLRGRRGHVASAGAGRERHPPPGRGGGATVTRASAPETTGRTAPSLWSLMIVGAVAGLLSGLFGVGGGVLIVPALVLALGFAQRIAHGTSLAAVVPISIVGAGAYLLHGSVDLRVAGLLMIGTVVGAMWGARLLSWLRQGVLRWLFIAFMLFVAVRMMLEVPARGVDIELTLTLGAILVGVGLLTGILSGLLGVGGGVFMVPVMVVLLGMSDLTAKGVSLLVVIPTGLVATWFSLRKGNVDLRSSAAIGLTGAVTSVGGAALAFLLDPQVASILFAAFLVVVAIRMAVHAIKQHLTPESKGSK
ncbi:sulfite exporter TauE/SafE family protein [Microbacterium alcoholitolerans]|uniref:sulfite exporter TauE/SafE family protein n=1 Tax=unclassified Microbacterium TaxID=2609290 RepID=UPI003D17ED18